MNLPFGSGQRRTHRTAVRAIAAAITFAVVGTVALAASSEPAARQPGARSRSGVAPSEPFDGSSRSLTATERRWMSGETWHRGCPVPMSNLRLLTMDYVNFDGDAVVGRMVVHRRVAGEMLDVFEQVYYAAFPIEHLDTTDLYPPALRPEKLRNVTGSFNCRPIRGTSTWSQHAFGLAVDINPVQNPYIGSTGHVTPPSGKAYRDRSQHEQGMIRPHGVVVEAFDGIGWGWGGRWHTIKDYMHFSQSGG